MRPLYDTIGSGYATQRVPDPRVAATLREALAAATTIANVGAGTGSYELPHTVVAIEPSMAMLRQRLPHAAPAVQAVAESLPLRDACVAAATAILTVHHWTDRNRGLQELARIARDRVAILTWDPDAPAFWLTEEYFPAIVDHDRRIFPSMTDFARALGRVSVRRIPIPHDCIDGFMGAFWRRPRAYLDAATRSGMSSFARLPGLEEGLGRLRHDLESGQWNQRHGHLANADSLDIGYCLVIAEL